MSSTLESHFLNLYSIALSDSSFDEAEMSVLYRLGEERGISRADIDKIILNPATVKPNPPKSLEEKVSYLYDYAKMIIADGVIENSELNALKKFCLTFGFEEENLDGITEVLLEAAKSDVDTTTLINYVTENT